jgi:predicted transcriptional regulator of viral defense system
VPDICRQSGDLAIAALADEQHGVVSRRQLLERGISPRSVQHRVEIGRLHLVHRGVYAVGRRNLTKHGRYMGAVLAVGDRAVLSHRSAADLWGLLPSDRRTIDVATPANARPRPGIRPHRTISLDVDETTAHHGIPTTTPARTLIDLAEIATRRELERALDQAEHRELLDLRDLQGGRIGAKRIRSRLRVHAPATTITNSNLEERFLALVDRAGLPRPHLNVPLALPDGTEIRADALWRTHHLVVELDGPQHARPRAARRDRSRDAQLQIAGFTIIRFTGRDIELDPDSVRAVLTTILRRP